MSNKKRLIIIVSSLTVIIALVALCFVYVDKKGSEYILQHVAVAYEDEAKNFYTENIDDLTWISSMREGIDEGEYYYYPFHCVGCGSPNIPSEIQIVLRSIERRTEQQFSFYIYQDRIRIHVADETNLIVTLEYGEILKDFAIKPEWGRCEVLDENWAIYTQYVIRS